MSLLFPRELPPLEPHLIKNRKKTKKLDDIMYPDARRCSVPRSWVLCCAL